jgi:hypothetical protein
MAAVEAEGQVIERMGSIRRQKKGRNRSPDVRIGVIFDRVQRGLPVGPFRFAPKSGHSASARVYEYTP